MSGEPDPDTKSRSVQELINRFEAPELETKKWSVQELKKCFEAQGSTHAGEKPLQQGRGVDSVKRAQEHCSQQSKGEGGGESLGRGRTVEENTRQALESFQEKELQQISQQMQMLQTALQNIQESTKQDLETLRADMENQLELFKMWSYKEDVSLDADTAHPRLEISDGGKSVKDTGTIRNVPNNEKRFDSHICVLAKEGYTSGRHYWEVDVGKRSSWALGIARESVTRKGTLTLSPKNGFWVMGFAHGREYWAYTEPWTRLSVGGKLQKIGIFLDISAKQLLFYNVHKKAHLYTFTIADGSSQEGKFLPFFSTGPATAKPDTEPLNIV